MRTLAQIGLTLLAPFLLMSKTTPNEPATPNSLRTFDDPAVAPPARLKSEVDAVVASEPKTEKGEQKPLRILLVAGKQDHGPGEHDYPAWRKAWKDLLASMPKVNVDTAENWPDKEQWEKSDLVVFYLWNHDWSESRYADLDAFLARGGGLVALHAAVIADKEPERLAKRFGLSSQPGRTKYRHGALDLNIAKEGDDPITRGFKTIHLIDETYWPPVGDFKDVHILATADEEGKTWPMLWTREVGKGRVFCSVLGHYTWTFNDPLFRVLILRGMAWASGEPIDRFEQLATKGVKLREAP